MSPKKVSPRIIKMMLFFVLLLAIACNNTTKIPTKIEGSSLIQGPQVTDPETYRVIRNNVARLRAMLTGEFVQYLKQKGKDKGNKYSVWWVNDNQDSIMMYSIPAGDPNKVGYWIYHYQIMTSLPDEPIYESFEELIELNRDSIKSTFYKAPKDFNLSLKELLVNYKTSFRNIEFSSLEIDEVGGNYVRKNILLFENTLGIKKDDESPDYLSDYYEVSPTQVLYNTKYYKDLLGEKFIEEYGSKFIKLSMFN